MARFVYKSGSMEGVIFLDFYRQPGETDDQLFERLLKYKSGMTWDEFSAIYSGIIGKTVNSAACRQRYSRMQRASSYDPFRDLQQKKQAFRDERTAWQKQNRDIVRVDVNFEELEAQLRTISGKVFQPVKVRPYKTGKKSMLVLLTDWHIGIEFANSFGHYSTEIAKHRAKTYLQEIYELQKIHKCEACYVMALGDMISGHIHPSVRLENRCGLIEQAKTAVELISNFLTALLKLFQVVTYTGCSGNHSRLIAQKDQNLRDDRLDLLIDWIISQLLQGQERFSYIAPLDTTLTKIDIYGREVVGIHGDYDTFGKPAIQNITSALHRYPWMICTGHMHSPAFSDLDGVKVIQGGSLSGSGDDYTVQKRLCGKPSQTIAIISERGLESLHPVEL